MPSDATHRSKLQQTIASLKAWTGFVADVARIEDTSVEDPDRGTAWRLALIPRTAHACPVAIVLHADQHYDLTIGGQTYAGLPVTSPDILLPLVEAIVGGRVITRRAFSTATGLQRSESTLVTLADGRVFEDGQLVAAAGLAVATDDSTEIHDTHYLPYRRSDARG